MDRTKTPTKLTTHAKYVAQVRAEGRQCSPYRLGFKVGSSGDSLPSPYTPGSRGDHSYLNGVEYGQASRRIEIKAQQLYHAATANDPKVHCNRFPSWDEMTGPQRWQWREKAIEALAAEDAARGVGACGGEAPGTNPSAYASSSLKDDPT